MSPTVKRRKPQTRPVTTSSHIKAHGSSGGLHTYLTVSKAAVTTVDILPEQKKKSINCSTLSDRPSSSRKRKLVNVENDSSPIFINQNHKSKRRSNGDCGPQTPCRPIILKRRETSSSERARGLLDKFIISSTPTHSQIAGLECLAISSPQFTSQNIRFSHSEPPCELVDLVNLNSAFLTAFSIHCAHNGTHCPADQEVICQEVARVWRKRSVTLKDLQRVIGIMNANIGTQSGSRSRLSQLTLSNYGHGKICIEVSEGKGNSGKAVRPVNVDRMNDIFARGLKSEWRKWRGIDVEGFIDSLPLEPIVRCASYVKISPLLAKGQRRIENIRDEMLNKKETSKKSSCDVDRKNTTLLERLRAKQLHLSTIPQSPSKSDIARKTSLTRVEEVSAVLTMLSTSNSIGQKRVSFTLPTVLDKLKDSLKLSHAEGELCIRLIAAEIAPEWVKIVNFQKKEAVVVDRNARPEDLEIRERVKNAEV
ncbi:putative dna mismatch repair protein msh-2 [Golovinomyces cichoracearum]|uniref:Putative dna mismatch repair protein msh-2 n=1 Tax=Golovinomyces cichoracearum TaxID=62708 RepID=A0A420J3Z3_9PEZI|nr:putative dna mismatch repair protein msh-2 [Golovinomyces cichoracearum]